MIQPGRAYGHCRAGTYSKPERAAGRTRRSIKFVPRRRRLGGGWLRWRRAADVSRVAAGPGAALSACRAVRGTSCPATCRSSRTSSSATRPPTPRRCGAGAGRRAGGVKYCLRCSAADGLVLCAQFLQQYHHYQSHVEIFTFQPDKPSKELAELVMFLAQVSRCPSEGPL